MAYNIASRVTARLRQEIEDGKYPLYSRLPPERQLCKAFGVSRVTMRKSLDVLEAEGRIRRHIGQGTFVGTSPAPKGGLVELGLQHSVTPQELLDAAMIVEPAIASHAALAATQADIDHMKECFEKRDSAATKELRQLWDAAFHQALADATHNRVLVLMYKVLKEFRQQAEWSSFRRNTLDDAWHRESTEYHAEILAGIDDRNPKRAFEGMRALLGAVRAKVHRIQN